MSHSLSGRVPLPNFIAPTNVVQSLLSHLSLSGIEFHFSVVNSVGDRALH